MKKNSARLTLLAILALFIFPLILAWLAFTGSIELRPEETGNQGQLIVPPIALAWDGVQLEGSNASTELSNHWVILMKPDSPCRKVCMEQIAQLRQVHRALGRHQDRVRVALLSEKPLSPQSASDFSAIYPEFKFLVSPDAAFNGSLARVKELLPVPGDAAPFYLVDPLGNIMMLYNTQDGPNRLSKDLKKLMAWSKLDTRQ